MIHAYRPNRRPARTLWALAAAATLTACQAPQPTDFAELTLKPAPPIDATTLYPLASHEGSISVQVGNQPVQTYPYRLNPTGEDHNHWRLRLETLRDTYLQQAADGAIQITREDEYKEGVWVAYDPPLILLPARLAMGKPTQQRTRMAVHNLTDGLLRDQGWCTYQVQLLGCKTVDTPDGRQDGYVLQTRRQIELQLAEVQVVSEAVYVPGVGWMREKIDRITKPMRLFEVRQSESLWRVDQGPPMGHELSR